MEVITINFEKKQGVPLYLQLYDTLVKQMLDGFIKQGDRLPSVRQLAKQLNLSKSTVENAYDRLVSEGYLISRVKSGYYCDIPIIKKEKAVIVPDYSHDSKTEPIRYDFSSRSMELSHFDSKVWRRYTRYALEYDQMIASYGENQGELFLREQLSNYLYRERGVTAKPDELVIGAGIQPLLYLFCSLFRHTTLKVGFLVPAFKQAVSVFEDCHHDIVLIDGLEDLKNHQIDVLYLNPASLDLKMNRRVKLLNDLREQGIYLIEDDHNGEMHYLSATVSSMQGLFDNEGVFYLSSFSKLLLPSVRLACMSIPKSFKNMLMSRLRAYNQTASKIEQHVLAQYIEDGHMERRVKRLKKLYLKKSKVMADALKKYVCEKDYHLLETSLCFEIAGTFSEAFYQRLKESHIRISYGTCHTLHLYFGGIPLADIEEGIDLIFKNSKQNI